MAPRPKLKLPAAAAGGASSSSWSEAAARAAAARAAAARVDRRVGGGSSSSSPVLPADLRTSRRGELTGARAHAGASGRKRASKVDASLFKLASRQVCELLN